MPTLVIKSNPAQATLVEIEDVGVEIPASGGSETFTTNEEIQQLILSRDLDGLISDDAHGAGSSTLILNDGTSDISQADAPFFLRSRILATTGAFSVPVRNDASEDDTLIDGLVPTNFTPTAQTAKGFWAGIDAALAGGGITASVHKTLRQLIHLADGVGGPMDGFASGAFREILPSADPFPTSVTWYDDATKVKKLVEKIITRNVNQTPATIVWKVYDTDGSTVLNTATDTIAYSGIFETDRTRTFT